MSKLTLITVLSLIFIVGYVSSHGMVINPVSRQSRWRFNSSAPINWDDDQLYCGSFGTHWNINKGKCGFCGDDWREPTPRKHEHGGKYGQGVIVAKYPSGGIIPTSIKITANHVGYFVFSLCNMDGAGAESDDCFQKYPLRLENGADRYPVPGGVLGNFDVKLRLPVGLTCSHCVLKWVYVAGNNWGCCDDGRCGMGCGPQENFMSCSDISVTSNRFETFGSIYDDAEEIIPEDFAEHVPARFL